MERQKLLDSYQTFTASNMHMLTHKGATATGPLRIANIFNEYFSSITEKTKANIKFSNKSFQDFLHHPNEESLFITPTDAHEVNLIISSLNSDKSTGPNSLPIKILKLLRNEISTHLADIFSLSFFIRSIPIHTKNCQYTKKNQSCFAEIIGQSLYYLTLIKSLKK